jgi:uncharacterized membrane protein (UPF0127 family)
MDMKNLQIINQRNGIQVATGAQMAQTWKQRLVGLLAHKELRQGQGMWLSPCKSVHTIGMRFPIDVIFLDKNNRIKKLDQAVKPYRICLAKKGAYSVLEVPAGTISKTELKRGDKLVIKS